VHQALQLLGQSLDDTQLAAAAIHAGRGVEDVSGLAMLVSRADGRAEHVSLMARQLLTVLREFPRRQDTNQATDLEGEEGWLKDAWRRGPCTATCFEHIQIYDGHVIFDCYLSVNVL
jgi:hypothetical protein